MVCRAIGQSHDRCRPQLPPLQQVSKTENRRANSRTTPIACDWLIVRSSKFITSCQIDVYKPSTLAVRTVVRQRSCRSIKLFSVTTFSDMKGLASTTPSDFTISDTQSVRSLNRCWSDRTDWVSLSAPRRYRLGVPSVFSNQGSRDAEQVAAASAGTARSSRVITISYLIYSTARFRRHR